MKAAHFKKIFFLLFCCCLILGCTEPYALQTSTFEDAIVIEATITNELKQQKVKVTHVTKFEDNGPAFEADANVYILDDLSNIYNFVSDPGSGYYVSTTEFQAEPERKYKLTVETSDGNVYESTVETLTTVNNMQDVTATVGTKNGESGVLINVKSFDPSNSSKYYRYEYEETYQVIAPAWSDMTLLLIPPPTPGPFSGYNVQLIPREDLDTKICYPTKKSEDIILANTSLQTEDRLDYTVRFISDQDYIISHRYSILVHQYVQNLAAYTFYKTLKEISGSGGNILSQNQPGFFYGNIKSATNPDKKVIGFFDVSSVSSKRIFFNYADLFPNKPLPPYVTDCVSQHFTFCFGPSETCNGSALVSALLTDSLLFFNGSHPNYNMVPTACGDCTILGSNIIPPFWE